MARKTVAFRIFLYEHDDFAVKSIKIQLPIPVSCMNPTGYLIYSRSACGIIPESPKESIVRLDSAASSSILLS